MISNILFISSVTLQSELIRLTTGQARFYDQKRSCANYLQVGGKSLKYSLT